MQQTPELGSTVTRCSQTTQYKVKRIRIRCSHAKSSTGQSHQNKWHDQHSRQKCSTKKSHIKQETIQRKHIKQFKAGFFDGMSANATCRYQKFCSWHPRMEAHSPLQTAECSALLRTTTGWWASHPERLPGKFNRHHTHSPHPVLVETANKCHQRPHFARFREHIQPLNIRWN